MTATADRRLDKIAVGLTPKEAVLVWLNEAQGYGSLWGYVNSLEGAPDEQFPLVRLTQQMEKTTRASLRGRPETEVWSAVRMAVRDVSFLYYLVSQINFRVVDHRRERWLHIALVGEMLRTCLEAESERLLQRWSTQAQEAARTVYVNQGVVAALAERYFDGQSPLYPDSVEDAAHELSQIEQLIEIYNDSYFFLRQPRSKRKPPIPQPLDLDKLRAAAVPAIQAETEVIVDLARCEAWHLIGEQKKGLALLERHVWHRAACTNP